MYSIRLTKQGHKVTVRHTTKNIVLKHTGKTGIQGEQGPIGIGLPTGGLAGQVIEKLSDTNYDLQWVTPSFAGDKNYTAEFGVTDTVAVNHNLNKLPSISVMDSAGDEVVGEIEYLNSNQVIVRFMYPFSGKVTCN